METGGMPKCVKITTLAPQHHLCNFFETLCDNDFPPPLKHQNVTGFETPKQTFVGPLRVGAVQSSKTTMCGEVGVSSRVLRCDFCTLAGVVSQKATFGAGSADRSKCGLCTCSKQEFSVLHSRKVSQHMLTGTPSQANLEKCAGVGSTTTRASLLS